MSAEQGDDVTELRPEDLVDVPETWPVHESEDVWRGSAPFAVRRDQVSLPGGDERFGRVVVEHPGAVVILAVDDTDRVLVLRQYRHPVATRLVELPAGLLDVVGEDPLVAAQRELVEEAGLEAGDWSHLASLRISPGISAEVIEVYLAQGLRSVPDRGGFLPHHEEADMSVHWVPFADLLDAVLERRLTDGPLAVAVLAHAVRVGRHQSMVDQSPRSRSGAGDADPAESADEPGGRQRNDG